MNLAMRSFAFGAIALGAFAACRSSNSGKNVDAAIDAAPTVSIHDVQTTLMPGTPVNLAGVVVTAIDNYGAKTGDIWVEDPAGGAYSGVHVYKGDPTVVSTLAVGDIVSISNSIKASFALSTDTSGRTETELEPPTSMDMVHITKTGTGTVPAPAVVDALAIGKMSDLNNNGDRSMAWAMWDGVLITVNNVTQTTSIAQIGGSTPDPTLKKFGITGVALLESSLSAFPSSGLAFDSCIGSATGVLSYFFDYQILQRNTSDIVTGGTGCPAPESGAACSNSVDDDGNGFSDCMDDNCIIDQSSCRATVTINGTGGIDPAADASPTMPTLPAGMPVGVEVDNVFVTAISTDKKNVWVAASKTAAADGGLDVFNGSGTLDASVVVGAKVTITGKLQAYNNDSQGETLPELDALGFTVASGSPGTIVPLVGQHASALNVSATGRPYVGTVVTIANVKIMTAPDPNNHNNATLTETVTGTATQFEALADAHVLTGAAGTCYATMTGVWTYDVYNDKYAFEPTGEGVGTGVCN